MNSKLNCPTSSEVHRIAYELHPELHVLAPAMVTGWPPQTCLGSSRVRSGAARAGHADPLAYLYACTTCTRAAGAHLLSLSPPSRQHCKRRSGNSEESPETSYSALMAAPSLQTTSRPWSGPQWSDCRGSRCLRTSSKASTGPRTVELPLPRDRGHLQTNAHERASHVVL